MPAARTVGLMRSDPRTTRVGRRVRRRLALAPVTAVMLLSIIGGSCTTSEWDTSEVDAPSTTAVRKYPRTEAGISASLVDHLAVTPENLNEWAPSRDDGACVAERALRRFTPDRLFALGFDPTEGSLALPYEPDERTAMVNIMVGCVDFEQAILELFSAYQKLPLRVAACMSRGIERLGLTRLLAAGLVDGAEPDPFLSDGALARGIAQLSVECTAPDDLAPNAPLPPMPVADTPATTGGSDGG